MQCRSELKDNCARVTMLRLDSFWYKLDFALQQEMLFKKFKQNSAIFCSFFTGMAFGVDKFHK